MVDLDEVVAEELTAHLDEVGAVEFELPDITTGERLTRPVAVLFTSACGKLRTDTYWSELWANWRQAAGWPKEGTSTPCGTSSPPRRSYRSSEALNGGPPGTRTLNLWIKSPQLCH